jgi:hypothetical protein
MERVSFDSRPAAIARVQAAIRSSGVPAEPAQYHESSDGWPTAISLSVRPIASATKRGITNLLGL